MLFRSLFALVLLACYFSNLSSSQSSDSTSLSVKGFEDLANQEAIEFGTLAGSSTLAFFKVREPFPLPPPSPPTHLWPPHAYKSRLVLCSSGLTVLLFFVLLRLL